MGVVWFFYDSKIKQQFGEEKEKYLPPELLALITEDRLTRIQKTGGIKIADIDQYEQMQGIESLQAINDRESIKQKKSYLYGILVAIFICVTVLNLFLCAMDK